MLDFVACGQIWGRWKTCTYFEVEKGLLEARHGDGVGLSLVTIMQEWQLKVPSRVVGVRKSDQIKTTSRFWWPWAGSLSLGVRSDAVMKITRDL